MRAFAMAVKTRGEELCGKERWKEGLCRAEGIKKGKIRRNTWTTCGTIRGMLSVDKNLKLVSDPVFFLDGIECFVLGVSLHVRGKLGWNERIAGKFSVDEGPMDLE